MPGQQVRLERENAQHMVCRTTDLVHALRTPGPDGRTDKVHRAHAGSAQVFFQSQVEIGRIHTHEQIRLVRQQLLAQLIANLPDARHATQHLQAVTMHGQRLARPLGDKALGLHVRTADPSRLQLRPALARTLQQQAGQQVTGGLACDHGQLQSITRCRSRSHGSRRCDARKLERCRRGTVCLSSCSPWHAGRRANRPRGGSASQGSSEIVRHVAQQPVSAQCRDAMRRENHASVAHQQPLPGVRPRWQADPRQPAPA